MHLIPTPPSAGGLASIALAASLPTAGTVVAVAVALLFVGVVWLGHRSSAAPPGGNGVGPGPGASGETPAPPAEPGRRRASP